VVGILTENKACRELISIIVSLDKDSVRRCVVGAVIADRLTSRTTATMATTSSDDHWVNRSRAILCEPKDVEKIVRNDVHGDTVLGTGERRLLLLFCDTVSVGNDSVVRGRGHRQEANDDDMMNE